MSSPSYVVLVWEMAASLVKVTSAADAGVGAARTANRVARTGRRGRFFRVFGFVVRGSLFLVVGLGLVEGAGFGD